MNSFSKKIIEKRKAKGLSQRELAELLNVDERTISRWENGRSKPRLISLTLKKILDLSDNEIAELLGEYKGYRFSDLFVNNSLAALADQLHHIEDQEFPVPEDSGNDFGDERIWLSLYEMSPRTGGIVRARDGEIAAHWFFIPVNKETYERGLNGENVNAEMTIENVDEFILPGLYDVYFVSLFIRDHYIKNIAISKRLSSDILDAILELAKNGMFIRRMFANMSSPRMISLARNKGFNYICNHKCHIMIDEKRNVVPTKIFEIELLGVEEPRVFFTNKALLKLYNSAKKKFLPDKSSSKKK